MAGDPHDPALVTGPPDIHCARCGTTREDLHTDGRMGCPSCYDTFRREAHRALLTLHGVDRHVGKGKRAD